MTGLFTKDLTLAPGLDVSASFFSLGLNQLLAESTADSIVAHAGGGQASATQLLAEMNKVITVATSGDSVVLPPMLPANGGAGKGGVTIIVENASANPMQVFGVGTETINGVAAGTGVSQMAGSVVIYTCYTAGAWFANGLGTGYAGSFETTSSVDNLVAHAGGGQASATPLTAMQNRVVTVGTAADSTLLPVSVAGMSITVVNAAASNSMNVFPFTGDAINALTANTALAVAAGKTITFYCVTAGRWHSILSA